MDSKHEESKDPAPSAEGQGENDELPANKFLELNEDDSGDEGNEIEKADLTYIKSEKTWEEVILSHPNKATMINQLVKLGFRKPSKIQQRSVPFIMANIRIGMSLQSQNGSGKTLAFVIPAILRVNTQLKLQKQERSRSFSPQVIIIEPNNELCHQTWMDVNNICEAFPEISCPRTGAHESEPGHILVKTAGKIKNMLDKRIIDLSNCRLVILDEVDYLLSEDIHRNPVDKIIFGLPKEDAGICCLSATTTKQSDTQIQKYFDHLKVQHKFVNDISNSKSLNIQGIYQFKRFCKDNEKIDYVKKLIELKAQCLVMIFVNTKKFAEILQKALHQSELKSEILLGGGDPRKRAQIIENFRRGKNKILITTNILARGFDERTVGLVVNFDIPREKVYDSHGNPKTMPDLKTYLHRVARTGRFGDVGLAVNLYVKGEEDMLNQIEEYYGMKIVPLEGDAEKTYDKIEDSLQEVIKINDQKRKELGEKRKIIKK